MGKSKEGDEEKPGSGSGRVLRSSNITNIINFTPVPSASARGRIGRSNAQEISSPKSRFQRRFEAGLKLTKGQVLFSCPACKSPVPSPIPPPQLGREEKRRCIGEIKRNESSGTGIDLSVSISISTSDEVPEHSQNSILKLRDEQISDPFESKSPESSDTGIDLSVSNSISTSEDPEHSQYSIQKLRDEQISNPFELRSPEFNYISISMIETPPFSPPIVEDGKSESTKKEYSSELQQTNTSLCPFLMSTSALSLSDSTKSSQNSAGCVNTRKKLKGRIVSPLSSSILNYYPKLKSSSSSSPLVGKANTANQSQSATKTPAETPYVVECQDCSYRFCSRCKFVEHPGKSCRLIGDNLDEEEEDLISVSLFTSRLGSVSSSRPRARSANASGKASKKASLRRLAYL